MVNVAGFCKEIPRTNRSERASDPKTGGLITGANEDLTKQAKRRSSGTLESRKSVSELFVDGNYSMAWQRLVAWQDMRASKAIIQGPSKRRAGSAHDRMMTAKKNVVRKKTTWIHQQAGKNNRDSVDWTYSGGTHGMRQEKENGKRSVTGKGANGRGEGAEGGDGTTA